MQYQPTNPTTKTHPFLKEMYDDDYFPNDLVDKGRDILLRLCAELEEKAPMDDAGVYALTHVATEEFNALAEEFDERDSEIETAAREAIAADIAVILKAYGFGHLDIEEAIAPRDW
jgi:hypothetical protein